MKSDHTVGSHSDDRGGSSDFPCYCNVRDEHNATDSEQSQDTASLPSSDQVDTHDAILGGLIDFMSGGSGTTYDETKAKLSAREVAIRIDELQQLRRGGFTIVNLERRIKLLEKQRENNMDENNHPGTYIPAGS